MMDDTSSIAYCAGLYEGEGSFYASFYWWDHGRKFRGREKKMRKTPSFAFKMAMTDLEPLQTLRQTFGGVICGPYKTKPGCKPKYEWTLSHTKGDKTVKNMARSIWPYLAPRRREQLTELYHWNSQMG